MPDISNGVLAAKINTLLTSWQTRENQLTTWLGGAVGAGDHSDGSYPLSDSLGNVQYVISPAQQAYNVTSTVNGAVAQAVAAAASAASSLAARVAAEAARDLSTASASAAATSAATALVYKNNAANYAAACLTYLTTVAADAADAAASAAAAAGAAAGIAGDASAAAASASAAAASATAAATSDTDAVAQAAAAVVSAGDAAGSATAAATSESNAASSATAAASSATGASTSATAAASSASDAATSEANAAASVVSLSADVASAVSAATAASGSATAAATSATNAATSETNAATSETNAASSAAAAVVSAAAAATSATSAAGSATTATTQAGNASTSATASSSSATAASGFATTATTQASNASSSASAAAASASAASTSATGAASSATSASGSATAAAASAAAAATFTPSLYALLSGATFTGNIVVNHAGTTINTVGGGAGFQLGDTSASTATFFQHAGGQTELYGYDGSWYQILKAARGGMTLTRDNTAYTNTDYFLQLNNTNASGQTALNFAISGTLYGRVRCDYAGNMSYVSTLSGIHAFFHGGDSGTGALVASFDSSGLRLGTANYDSVSSLNDGWLRLNNSSSYTNGIFTPGPLRADGGFHSASSAHGLTYDVDGRNIDFSVTTYGTVRLNGSSGGYVGLMVNDGAYGPTLMSSATFGNFGVYAQTASRWSWYDDSTNFQIGLPPKIAGGEGIPYYIAGGSGNTRITSSTSGPSGTPNDGDIWFQHA